MCAGWITPAVLASLEIDPADYGRERVIQPIRAFRVGLLAGPDSLRGQADIAYPSVVSYGIRRREFDDYLLARSRARLLTGEALRGLRREGKGWLANDRIRAAVLVGAGGHACPVARELGARPGDEKAVVAQEIEFLLPEAERADCQVAGERPELYFCADLAGYGWCFRKGDHLNVGLGREDRHGFPEHMRGFLDFLSHARGIPALPGRLRGHAYLLHGHHGRQVAGDAALLVGDAAGLAYPASGEGIRPAVESGLLAARTLIEARGNYRRERLAPYQARLGARFGAGRSLTDALPAGARALLARLLFRHPALVRRLILDRGFLRGDRPGLPAT